MGHYTQLKCRFKLRKDTPENVLSLLKRMIIDQDLGHKLSAFTSDDVFKPGINHEFFKCERWWKPFMCTNGSEISGGKMYKEKGYDVVDLHTDFKNYDNEIQKFFDWISPYILGRKKKQYLGWCLHDQADNFEGRANIYINRYNHSPTGVSVDLKYINSRRKSTEVTFLVKSS